MAVLGALSIIANRGIVKALPWTYGELDCSVAAAANGTDVCSGLMASNGASPTTMKFHVGPVAVVVNDEIVSWDDASCDQSTAAVASACGQCKDAAGSVVTLAIMAVVTSLTQLTTDLVSCWN